MSLLTFQIIACTQKPDSESTFYPLMTVSTIDSHLTVLNCACEHDGPARAKEYPKASSFQIQMAPSVQQAALEADIQTRLKAIEPSASSLRC